jgi:quercetin 2,3-dioxygenase
VHPNRLGSLKVVNEDRIKAAKGFGEHEHADYEVGEPAFAPPRLSVADSFLAQIWTYLIKGELEHHDSMGNVEASARSRLKWASLFRSTG